MHAFSGSIRQKGKTIGFVPTMGYLHEGHLSLVRTAKETSDIVVVSIFVNPAQFAPNEDLSRYPRDFERDKSLLEREQVDVIFYPDVKEIYSDDFQTYVEVQNITKGLEGASRPTHFKGVTTIVSILFNAVRPDIAVFGQKDAQQAAVIKQMVKDLKFNISVLVAPIVRENDGLAMSSRNIYLSPEERKDALVLSRALTRAGQMIECGETNCPRIVAEMKEVIKTASSSQLDYIKIVNASDFADRDVITDGSDYYILVACKIGKTRLIDNILVKR